MTGFAVKVADKSLPEAFDLLADLLANPRFDQTDLDREQKVILEEMKMVEDTPDELLGELFNAAYFPGHALGRPIEGTEETISAFDRNTIAGYHEREFLPANLVVAAAGNVAHQQLVELVERSFANNGSANGRPPFVEELPTAAAPILIEQKQELEQAHLVIAAPWPNAKDNDRYAASMLASVIGGGTSSRLWQTVREERGLAYSVGAGGSTFSDVGVFTIYAGTSPEHLDEVLDLSLEEMRRVVSESVSEEELKLVKDQALSSILLGLESSSSRVSALARQEIIHGRRISPAESIEQLEAVTTADMQRVAGKYFTSESLALGALGNLNGFNVDRSRLKI
jgi:predicted Zn-dependent peptidase